jgi:hypothetical protein
VASLQGLLAPERPASESGRLHHEDGRPRTGRPPPEGVRVDLYEAAILSSSQESSSSRSSKLQLSGCPWRVWRSLYAVGALRRRDRAQPATPCSPTRPSACTLSGSSSAPGQAHAAAAVPRAVARSCPTRVPTGPRARVESIGSSVRRPGERIAPFAPVNPSGFASGVLRFAPALRVTAAKPGGGGLIKFMSRAGLASLSAFLLRARLR